MSENTPGGHLVWPLQKQSKKKRKPGKHKKSKWLVVLQYNSKIYVFILIVVVNTFPPSVWGLVFYCRALFRRTRALLGLVQTLNFSWAELIQWINYMENLASESIRNTCFNLEGLCHSNLPSPAGDFGFGRTLEQLWCFDAELFMSRT